MTNAGRPIKKQDAQTAPCFFVSVYTKKRRKDKPSGVSHLAYWEMSIVFWRIAASVAFFV